MKVLVVESRRVSGVNIDVPAATRVLSSSHVQSIRRWKASIFVNLMKGRQQGSLQGRRLSGVHGTPTNDPICTTRSMMRPPMS